jgi:hypothetical protein
MNVSLPNRKAQLSKGKVVPNTISSNNALRDELPRPPL